MRVTFEVQVSVTVSEGFYLMDAYPDRLLAYFTLLAVLLSEHDRRVVIKAYARRRPSGINHRKR